MTQKYSLLREERETAYQSINNGFIAAHLLFKTEAGYKIWIRSMQKVFSAAAVAAVVSVVSVAGVAAVVVAVVSVVAAVVVVVGILRRQLF